MDEETIYIWADGTWCSQDEGESFSHRSDDYEVVSVPCAWDYSEIDQYVHARGTNR